MHMISSSVSAVFWIEDIEYIHYVAKPSFGMHTVILAIFITLFI